MVAADADSRGTRQFNAPVVARGLGGRMAELLGTAGHVAVVGVQELARIAN